MSKWVGTVTVSFIALLLLIHPSPKIYADVDTTTLGVSVGDIFTYVLDEYVSGDETHLLGYNDTLKEWLKIREKGEFNITITNTTVDSNSFGHYIGVTYSNISFVVEGNMPLGLIIGSALLTDWDFYEINFTAELNQLVLDGDATSYNLTNGPDEFQITIEFSDDSPFYNFIDQRFDKITGMNLYSYLNATFTSGDPYMVKVRQKGYVLASEQLVVTNSTSSSTLDQTSPSSSITSSLSSTTSLPVISDTSSSLSSDSSSDGSAFVPGFTIFIGFTALITTFTFIRYKKY